MNKLVLIILFTLISFKSFADKNMMIGSLGKVEEINRTIRVVMYDNYYEPSTFSIKSGETIYKVSFDGGKIRFRDSNLTYGTKNSQRYSIREGDPLSAVVEYKSSFSFERGSWIVSTSSQLQASCDKFNFFLKGRISAFEKNEEVYSREWDIRIPRTVF